MKRRLPKGNIPRHPIQIAARRSALTADVLRAWERRYAAIRPGRSESNRRLYSDDDIERLRALGRVVRSGRRIADVAGLSTDELRSMDRADRDAEARSRSPAPVSASRADHLASCLDAVERLDAPALATALSLATVDLSVPELLDELLAPLMEQVGQRWRTGALRIAHEHLATATARSFLAGIAGRSRSHGASPEVVVATPRGQRHEIGALMVGAAAAAQGWKVTYLGTDLPAVEIASAARIRGARVVALSIVHPSDDPGLDIEIAILSAHLDATTALVVGGRAARAYSGALAAAGAAVVPDLSTFRSELVRLGALAPRA